MKDSNLAVRINGKIYDLDLAMPIILPMIQENRGKESNTNETKELMRAEKLLKQEKIIENSLKLKSDQLRSFNLRKGQNIVTYQIENGGKSINGKIYM